MFCGLFYESNYTKSARVRKLHSWNYFKSISRAVAISRYLMARHLVCWHYWFTRLKHFVITPTTSNISIFFLNVMSPSNWTSLVWNPSENLILYSWWDLVSLPKILHNVRPIALLSPRNPLISTEYHSQPCWSHTTWLGDNKWMSTNWYSNIKATKL